MTERIGDAPLDPAVADKMRALAKALDEALNGKRNVGVAPPTTGFVLMVFPVNGHEGRCNYVSNARREDIVVLLREQLLRFSSAPDVEGRA